MNKTFLSIILLLAVLPLNTEALFDFLTVQEKRNNQIKSIICETLKTQNTTWVRVRSPITESDGLCTRSIYRKKQDAYAKYPELEFYFTELNYSKYPSIHTLSQLFECEKQVTSIEGEKKCTDNQGNLSVFRVRQNLNLIDLNNDTMLYEIAFYSSEQKMKHLEQKSLFGPTTEIIFSKEPEVTETTPELYLLIWVRNLGNRKFRDYRFLVKGKRIQEEKDEMVQLFQKIEERINSQNKVY